MALLRTKKKAAVESKADVKTSSLILGARITEKASILAGKNVYTFTVASNTTKSELAKAIKTLHKVTPVAINMVKIPERRVTVRGKVGVAKGGKKAYITLKKGDTIAFA